MRHDMKIGLCGVMIVNALLCACFADDMAEKQAKWTELENYGVARFHIKLQPNPVATNGTLTATIAYDDESDRKWFCEMVSFSMPTNDVEAYSLWLYHKTQLIEYSFFFSNAIRSSVDSWRQLAIFLADMKARHGSGDSTQFMREHKEQWKHTHPENTFENFGKWRKAYMRARWYRSTLGRAITDTERTIEYLAKRLSPSQKKVLAEIIREHTGKTPDWYLEDKGGQGDARKQK